jgi:hypothetical protein
MSLEDKQKKNLLKMKKSMSSLQKTPYWNLMLDKQILKTKERFTWHMLFLPQKVV